MEFGKVTSNPMLMGVFELMKDDPTDEHRAMFVDELAKASFMAPVNLVPAPVQTPDGRWVVDPDVKLHFPLIRTTEGVEYFMGFTDQEEFDKWVEKTHPTAHFALTAADYANMLFTVDDNMQETQAQGLVINPFGANIVLPRTMMAGLLIEKMPELRDKIVAFRKKHGLNPEN